MNEHGFQRVALVTGGAVRLGRAISLGLAEAGFDVALHYRASEAPALEASREIRALGRACATVRGDLGDPASADAVVAAVREAFGRLDLLVNSAAGFAPLSLADADADAWDRIMDVNVRAPHLLVRAAADLLRAAGGAVVNVVDLSAFQPWRDYPVHAVSKAALAHLTRVQARSLAPDVRVNAVAPGAVLPPDDYPPERVEELRVRAPLRAVGTPQDVVEAVLYLADARYVTGQILAVDGGRMLGSAARGSDAV
jgi:pteridine reductase